MNTLNYFLQTGTVCACVSVLVKIVKQAATAGVSLSFVSGVPSSARADYNLHHSVRKEVEMNADKKNLSHCH